MVFQDEVAACEGLLLGGGAYDFFFDQEQLARLVLRQLDQQDGVLVAGRLQQDVAQTSAGADGPSNLTAPGCLRSVVGQGK